MRNIFQTTNGFGNPIFKLNVNGDACKIVFDSNGCIIKAFCGNSGNLALIYSRDDADETCLKEAMYEMLLLSQECFLEMFNEIKSQTQITCAKEVIAQRSKELKQVANQALESASKLDSIL